MGQVIAFPAHPTPCPGRVADLGFAENVLLVAIRCWVEAYRGATIPSHAFAKGSRAPGLLMPRFSIDALVTIVARAVRRPVEVHCPGCPNVSDDEKRRLYAASLAQAGVSDFPDKVLRTTLLSAEGAAFAIGSLEGLGELFSHAWLFVTRRTSTAQKTHALH
jgi:hypothetical protein